MPRVSLVGLLAVCSFVFLLPRGCSGWSAASEPSTRRRIWVDASVGAAAFLLATPGCPRPARAAYGDVPALQGFDYIEFLLEKNAAADPSTFLYQGADRAVQLQRLRDAARSLQTIPDTAANRQWSRVQGVLTGPLGTLLATMNAVATTRAAKDAAQKVKADLFAISDAATKKNAGACSQATDKALQDLKTFVQVVF